MPKFLSTAKGKISTALAIASIGAMNAAAAGVAIGADGAVTGDIDPKTFFGMATVVVALLGVIYGVKAGIRLLRG
jgi:hypothetical protein